MNDSMVPALFEAILDDYNRNVPAARDAEVLNVTNAIVGRLQSHLIPQIPAVLDAVFECTLAMISLDFTEWPEHRTGFFQLLKSINKYCFPGKLSRFRLLKSY